MTAVATEFLQSLPAYQLAAYLQGRGWSVEREYGHKGALWRPPERAAQAGAGPVLVPATQSVGDYALRVADVLDQLERIENRSAVTILSAILETGIDVIRVMLSGTLTSGGTIPLDRGSVFVSQARDVFLAAACAAIEPRAAYSNRKPQRALDFLNILRLGQTEVGSYVLNVKSPLPPPSEQQAGLPGVGGVAEEPFERTALTVLGAALSEAHAAAEASGDITGRFGPAVARGVSANLCAAIANILDNTGADAVGFGFSWSPIRPARQDAPDEVVFELKHSRALRDAARSLREMEPEDAFEMVGSVVGLRREEEDPTGLVVVAGMVYGNLRKVRMVLAADVYHLAVQAHDQRQIVRCVGELQRVGRSLTLEDVTEFDVVDVTG